MANFTQYYSTNSIGNRSYGSIPSDVLNNASSRIGAFDNYYLLRTAQYEYTLIVDRPVLDDVVIKYTNDNGYYRITESTIEDYSVTITSPCNAYSSISNKGTYLEPASNTSFLVHCLGTITIIIILMILFGSVLFRWLLKR